MEGGEKGGGEGVPTVGRHEGAADLREGGREGRREGRREGGRDRRGFLSESEKELQRLKSFSPTPLPPSLNEPRQSWRVKTPPACTGFPPRSDR